MEAYTVYETKLNSINKLTIEIEEDFNNQYSVVAYDDNNNFFIERFAPTFEQAKEVAKKLHDKIVKEY